MLKSFTLFGWLVSLIIICCVSCKPAKQKRPSFKEVLGINFLEYRREFDTGYSFSNQGFQQIPEWDLYFLPGDSVKIYSPYEKRYIHYPMYYDHGQVFNFAREWLRIIHVSKDSLTLQLLKVQDKEVKRELSTVYMKFYSKPYIQRVLKADLAVLRRPSPKDTLFIKKLIDRSRRYPGNLDSLLASRNPPEFQSRIPAITIKKREVAKDDLDYSPSDTYLNPEYDIEIRGAYKDFNHTFTAVVDANGKIKVGRFAYLDKDFMEPFRKRYQAIIDAYIHPYVNIKPGSTLGIRHATEILLHVNGTK